VFDRIQKSPKYDFEVKDVFLRNRSPKSIVDESIKKINENFE